ncbi:MAG: Hpt domain-containing protein [Alkalilacustris sp.]
MIDWDRVRELRSEVGAEDFAEVVELFLSEVDDATARLAAGPDRSRLQDDLHFIKGSAYNLGFDRLGTLCAAGEQQAAAGNADQVDLDALLECYAASRRAFVDGLDDQDLL